jgi:hypothetical protein
MAKADALLRLGDLNQARMLLATVGQITDVSLLRRAAEIEDLYGRGSAELYQSLAMLTEKTASARDRLNVLRRGLEVSIRDGDLGRAH